MQVLAVEADKVTKEASFADDLDADSLDLAELVMALEDEFDITVEEDELEGINTVGQAFDMVDGQARDVGVAMELRRVAVTGVGVLSSCGTGVDDFWAGPQRAAARGRAPGPRLRPGVGLRQPEGGPPGRPRHAARPRRRHPGARRRPATIDGDPLRRGVLIATGIGGHRHARGADHRLRARRAPGGCRRSSCR